MNDRELLELAAKAQGWIDYPDDSIEAGDYWHTDPKKAPFDLRIHKSSWNPLTDDGDALRLAVKLCLHIQIDTHVTYVDNVYWADECNGYPHNDDPYAATRRAIVRAAAEIGKEQL